MKKSNIYLVIFTALLFVFSLTMMFVLNRTKPINGQNLIALYYIAKLLSLFALLGIVIYILAAKKEVASMTIMIIATAFLQIYPLVLRMWIHNGHRIAWPIAVTFLVFIGYAGLFLLVDIFKDKAVRADQNLQGKEIAVKDESDYYDENGKFVGRKGGK